MSLDRSVYLRKGAVICSQADVLGAYLGGYRMGGEVQGHRAVERLFRYPDGGCVRSFFRDQVQVLDASISDDKLVNIKWAGLRKQALPEDLSNWCVIMSARLLSLFEVSRPNPRSTAPVSGFDLRVRRIRLQRDATRV